MVNGGTWINRDKRGFHGASSVVEEEEICITWLLVSSKTDDMIKHLFELVYGKLRLSVDPSVLQTFNTVYAHFKK